MYYTERVPAVQTLSCEKMSIISVGLLVSFLLLINQVAGRLSSLHNEILLYVYSQGIVAVLTAFNLMSATIQPKDHFLENCNCVIPLVIGEAYVVITGIVIKQL